MADLIDRARDHARDLHFVADHRPADTDVTYKNRVIVTLANAFDEIVAELEYLHAIKDQHELTKIRLAEAQTEIARLQAVARG